VVVIIPILLAALVISLLVTPVARAVAIRYGVVDRPGPRKVQMNQIRLFSASNPINLPKSFQVSQGSRTVTKRRNLRQLNTEIAGHEGHVTFMFVSHPCNYLTLEKPLVKTRRQKYTRTWTLLF